jgi:enamine deaminase RidA (YjgF/YER057c/UK114 family)
METRIINPWTWQDQFGFVQANALSEIEQVLICSGQIALNAEGQPIHAGDMRGQVTAAMDNLETVLRTADLNLADVVKLTIYTTDVDAYFEAIDIVIRRTSAAGCQPAMTLLGISRLAFPELLVEIEAIAAR